MRRAALLLTVLLAACGAPPSTLTPPAPIASAPSANITAYGVVQFTVGGAIDPQAVSSTTIGGFTFTRGATTTYEDGTYRYVNTEYTVQNTSTVPRSNVTLLAAGASNTIPGTPWRSFRLADGTLVDGISNPALAADLAKQVRPTHGTTGAATPDLGVVRASFQAYQEADVTPLTGKSGVTNAFPWGFVTTKAGGNRTLQAGQSGTFTLSVRAPKSTNVTGFTLSMVAVTDTAVRTTRDLLERASDPTGSATTARSSSLRSTNGGVTVEVVRLPADPGVSSCTGCTTVSVSNLRLTGTSGAPTSFLLTPPAFQAGPSAIMVHRQHTATLLPNGKVLLTGGSNEQTATELYDPATNTFVAGPNMTVNRREHTATLLPNGKVLIAGGFHIGDPYASRATDLYDPVTNTITPGPTLTVGRYDHSATLLQNGKVLIASGQGLGGTILTSTELYDPNTNTVTPGPTTIAARYSHTATLLPDGKVLIVGGDGTNGRRWNTTELYDPATNTFAFGPTMSTGRTVHTATLLPNGKVLIAGGVGDDYLRTTDMYDPLTNTLSRGPDMNSIHTWHTATLLPDGKVLMLGGITVDSAYNEFLQEVTESYDPGANNFTVGPNILRARSFHTATLLSNGNVLVAGGYNGDATTELYVHP
ncbi:Kelch repeat-containing protein [Deinococcus yavapaiensis]|uniref:Galactose oxidase-like protein n=1 Tax=Deinococcus yavapaiensis KR-236 TaxID=694435 RepID=A0A318S3S0_9DEIO|nr:kelch repeat-containing protein [Deinococcus yavapaiensis]PYE53158.1 galactose oxidase-like protein [Deinococcus yavapaiensis KR-236]